MTRIAVAVLCLLCTALHARTSVGLGDRLSLQPRVNFSLAFSGGGLRAMLGSIVALNVLDEAASAPLPRVPCVTRSYRA
jgi:hypothetical protein